MSALNLYLLSQTTNDDYDTFDSCVVVAADEESAKTVHPYGDRRWVPESGGWCMWSKRTGRFEEAGNHVWSAPEFVKVTLVGAAHESLEAGRVVCASFNAG